MFLYYITDRKQLSPDPADALRLLLERIATAAHGGVDAIQIREKDLSARAMVELGRKAASIVSETNSSRDGKQRTRVLINSRVDVAIACGADGVHLRSDDLSPADARSVLIAAGLPEAVIGVSCHTEEEVELAEGNGADFAVFGPVFGKRDPKLEPSGIEQLEVVCKQRGAGNPKMPVLALGGITAQNTRECLQAGAAGIAGIRIFQDGNAESLSRLRRLQ